MEALVSDLRIMAEFASLESDSEIMNEAADRIEALEAALQHIVRECGALNKGPVAVHLALAALNPRTTAQGFASE